MVKYAIDMFLHNRGIFRMIISAAQIRAARALLGWTQANLAEATGLSEIGIQSIEKNGSDPRASSLRAIEAAFEAAGVEFTNGGEPGVKKRALRVGDRVRFLPGKAPEALKDNPDSIGTVFEIEERPFRMGPAPMIRARFGGYESSWLVAGLIEFAVGEPSVRTPPIRSIDDALLPGHTLDPLEVERDPFEAAPTRVRPKRPRGAKRRDV
jgi:transcriptional regulator with XRE-family HTH domain